LGSFDQTREGIKVRSERTVLAALRLPDSKHDPADPFGELRALVEQAGAVVVGELEQRLPRPVSATFMGSGKVDELKRLCEQLDATLVVFDHDLSPSQIGNIEKVVGRKIVDRSELILDIFASRATTHEAKLQVELAQLEYTYPRLRAMWDHLERIVGGGGLTGIGTRGPGEQQLEIDRRLVQRRKLDLKAELDQIHARKSRMVRQRREEHFTVCLVGYTNAGKSTLFNALTGLSWGEGRGGGAYADDRVFATLVTRTREWNVGGPATPNPEVPQPDVAAAAPASPAPTHAPRLAVMLSDTVGFVRDLPHNLVASFRATLEEAVHADLLLIVLDVADPSAEAQFQTVSDTLDGLMAEQAEIESRSVKRARGWSDEPADAWAGRSTWTPPRRLVVLNKVDRLADNRALLVWQAKHPDAVALSAVDPAGPVSPGFQALRTRVRELAQGGLVEATLAVPMDDGKIILKIEGRAEVLERTYDDAERLVRLRVRIGRRQLDEVRAAARRLEVAVVAAVD
jgi:GTP-binding protein HflX